VPSRSTRSLGISINVIANTGQRNITWTWFSVSVFSTWFIGEFGWALAWYFELYLGLAVVTVLLGAAVLFTHQGRLPVVALVSLGLVIATWRFLEGALMVTVWSIGGFAP
jgi:hypothetical protein